MKTFTRGRTTFKCDICKHLTRYTGVQGSDSTLCPDCWELAGYENQVSDSGDREGELERSGEMIRGFITAIDAKGANSSVWKTAVFPELFQLED